MSRALLGAMLLAAVPFCHAGENIWKGTCQACHAEPLSGAPLISDKAAWAPRVAATRRSPTRR